MYSWVHIEDTCRMIEWIYDHKEINGTYNSSSPNPVTNEEFMRTFRKVTGHIIGLPAYKWMLQIGAPLIGTELELVLKVVGYFQQEFWKQVFSSNILY
jgi:NAD dependent epimerase/dehydratase family enzyme